LDMPPPHSKLRIIVTGLVELHPVGGLISTFEKAKNGGLPIQHKLNAKEKLIVMVGNKEIS